MRDLSQIIKKFGAPPHPTGEKMNNVVLRDMLPSIDSSMITNVEYKEAHCPCPYHKGSYVRQVSFRGKTSGNLIIVMEDFQGYHVSVGLWDDDVPPPCVSKSELREIIIEALYCD